MRILLDTNVLLISLPSQSPFRGIINGFSQQWFDLVLTSDIFLEYEEILTQKANPVVATNFLTAIVDATNVIRTDVYFRWELITADPDDNKFTDAYIAAGADYLVTTDSHFEQAKRSIFPKINIVSPETFLEIIERLS